MLFTEAAYAPCAYFVKLSILLFYLRVLATPSSKSRLWIWGGIWAITPLYLVIFILSFSFCIPDDSIIDGGTCVTKGGAVGWAQSAVNITTDIYLLAIPIFVLTRLQMPLRRKLEVGAVFFMGVL
jgi:hypothetical protein